MSIAETIADKLGELFALQEERTRAQIDAGLIQTRNALRLQGARTVTLNGNAGTQSVWAGPGRLVGWSVLAGASPVTVSIYDGRPDSYTTADLVAVFALTAGQSANHAGGGGVSITEACTVVVAGGTVTGAIHLGAKD